ncbi:MAG: sigma-70 family RNA polymerase sigma factor [Acidobacteriota bacterium]
MKDPMTDAELVARTLAGSPDAFRVLVERYQRPMLSLIVRMVGDPSLAEDLAQEAFVKAYRKLHTFQPQRKLSSWLFKIAHNTTIDHLRRAKPELTPLEATSAEGDESWEFLQVAEEEGPEYRAVHRQLVGGLEAALGRLPPRYREILILRFQQSLAYHEIAEVTGLAMGTVKVQLHRARKQLAAALAEAGFAPPGKWSGKSGGRA